MTRPGARIIAYATDADRPRKTVHRAYRRRNLERGRLGGQLRIRVRHRGIVGPWMEYLLVSRAELRRILRGTPWRAERFYGRGAAYAAVIVKR